MTRDSVAILRTEREQDAVRMCLVHRARDSADDPPTISCIGRITSLSKQRSSV